MLSSKDFPGAIPQVVAVSRTALENHGDDIQGLVLTWFDTLQFIEGQPMIAEPIMLERWGTCAEHVSCLSATDYQRFMEGVHFFSQEENATAFSPGDTWEHLDFTIQKAAEFLVDVGAIDEGPEVENMLSVGLPMRSMYRPLDGVLRDTGYAQVNLS